MGWTPGTHGKGIVLNGQPHTWTSEGRGVAHYEYLNSIGAGMLKRHEFDSAFAINPDGAVDGYYGPAPQEALQADPRLRPGQSAIIEDRTGQGDWNLSSVQDLQLVPWAHGEPGKFVLFEDGLVDWSSRRSRAPESMGGPFVHHWAVAASQDPGRRVRAMGAINPNGSVMMHGAWGVEPSEVEQELHGPADMDELDRFVREDGWTLSRTAVKGDWDWWEDPASEWQPGTRGKGGVYLGGPLDGRLKTWTVDAQGQPHHVDGLGVIDWGSVLEIRPDGSYDVMTLRGNMGGSDRRLGLADSIERQDPRLHWRDRDMWTLGRTADQHDAAEQSWSDWHDEWDYAHDLPEPGENGWTPGTNGKAAWDPVFGATAWTIDSYDNDPHHPWHTPVDFHVDPDGSYHVHRNVQGDPAHERAARQAMEAHGFRPFEDRWTLSRVVEVQPGGGGHPPSKDHDWTTWHPFIAGKDGHVYVGGPGDWHGDVRGQMPCYPRGMGAVNPASGEVWLGSGWDEGPSKEEVLPQLRDHFGVEPRSDWWTLSRTAVIGPVPGEPREGAAGTPIVVDASDERFWVGKPGQYHEDVWRDHDIKMDRPAWNAHNGLVHRGPNGLVVEWYEGFPHPQVNEELAKRFGEPVEDEGASDEEWRLGRASNVYKSLKGITLHDGTRQSFPASKMHVEYLRENGIHPDEVADYWADYDDGGHESLSDVYGRDFYLKEWRRLRDEDWRLSAAPDWRTPPGFEPWRPGTLGKGLTYQGIKYRWLEPDQDSATHYQALEALGAEDEYNPRREGVDYQLTAIAPDGEEIDAKPMVDHDGWFAPAFWDDERWRLSAVQVLPVSVLDEGSSGGTFHPRWVYEPETNRLAVGGDQAHHEDLHHELNRGQEFDRTRPSGRPDRHEGYVHPESGEAKFLRPWRLSEAERGYVVRGLEQHLGQPLSEQQSDWRLSAAPPAPNDPSIRWGGLSLRDGSFVSWPQDADNYKAHVEYMIEHGLDMNDVARFWAWTGDRWTAQDRFRDQYKDIYEVLAPQDWRLTMTATTIQEGTLNTGESWRGEHPSRKPFLYDPRRDTAYVGQLGASHFDLINEFDPDLEYLADDDVGEGGMHDGQVFFYPSNWRDWNEDYPHILQTLGDRYGVEPDYGEDEAETSDWAL